MNQNLHNIDDLFKKALEEHNELPSEAVWDNIDKSLDQKKVISISKKYNKLKWAAALLLLFLIGMAMYTLHIRRKNKELVEQNNGGIILKNLKKKAIKNSEVPKAFNLPGENTAESKKTQIRPEPAARRSNISSTNKTDNKIQQRAGAKNFAATTRPGLVTIPGNKKIISGAEEKPDEATAKQDQKQVIEKNKPGINIKEGSVSANSDDNVNKNPPGFPVTNTDKKMSVAGGQKDELHPNIFLQGEKYTGRIPLMPVSKDLYQTLVIQPFSNIPGVMLYAGNSFNDNNIIGLKKRKPGNSSRHLISATAFFSPDLVFQNIHDDHPRFREEDRDEIEKHEKAKFSSTIGVIIGYNIVKNWLLESGLTYSTRVTDIQPKTIYARPDNNGNINFRYNCSSGYSFITTKSSGSPVSGDSLKALSSQNTLHYIGLPLAIKHVFTKGRFSLAPGVGVSANFLTKGKISTTIATTTGDENATSNDIQGLKSLYFNGSVGIGAQYKMSKTLALAFTPTFRFALSSINKDAPVKTYVNALELDAGLLVKF
ncbi:MAG: outer membrane beta-barrel protein [Ginsengibacter sp.]